MLIGDHNFIISKKNQGKNIIFSSCLIGKNEKLSISLKEFFGAQSLFAYQHEMEDRFCFLNESILLTLMDHTFEKKEYFTERDFQKFQENTAFMKNINQKNVKNHPMKMF